MPDVPLFYGKSGVNGYFNEYWRVKTEKFWPNFIFIL